MLGDGRSLLADFVVLAVGVTPDSRLAREAGLELGKYGGIKVDAYLRTSDPNILAAGDAIEVVHAVTGEPAQIPLAGPANRQGRIAAENVCGRNSVYVSTKGTAILKVFGMTAGMTGATEKALRRKGMPFRKIYLHPAQHAGYYPGATPLHMKVLFDPDTRKLLGAQVVGREGVDKRIDVLALALSAGLVVQDLATLELAYAPPYGSARDPVNQVGFIAGNLDRGDVAFWYAEDYPAATAETVVLDVRGKGEFEAGHIPGALHIPLPMLRISLDKVPPGKPVRVYCKVGYRSYLAYRILKQNGREAATLAGGLQTFCHWHGEAVLAKGAG